MLYRSPSTPILFLYIPLLAYFYFSSKVVLADTAPCSHIKHHPTTRLKNCKERFTCSQPDISTVEEICYEICELFFEPITSLLDTINSSGRDKFNTVHLNPFHLIGIYSQYHAFSSSWCMKIGTLPLSFQIHPDHILIEQCWWDQRALWERNSICDNYIIYKQLHIFICFSPMCCWNFL